MIIWTIEANLNLHAICFCLLLLHTIITILIDRTEVCVNYNYHKCKVFYEELGFLIILFANFFNLFLLHFIRLRHHKWYGNFFFSIYIYILYSELFWNQISQTTNSKHPVFPGYWHREAIVTAGWLHVYWGVPGDNGDCYDLWRHHSSW